MSLSTSRNHEDSPASSLKIDAILMSDPVEGKLPSDSDESKEIAEVSTDDSVLSEKEEGALDAPKAHEEEGAHEDAKKEEIVEEKRARKSKWAGIALDTLLVLLVVGACAGGTYYLRSQWNKYRVPTILELTQKECLTLCEQREALQDAANHADEQLSMRRKLSQLENKLSEFSDKNAQLRASLADQQKRVLALQHEIRQIDRESRGVARGLLPGLPIGNVTTTRGRTYNNATISRLQGKRISLRTPEGAASLPISELVKDRLPDIALYALGEIDLVDMTDFTADGTAPSDPVSANTKLRKDVRPTTSASADYEGQSSGPVVDTNANKTSIDVSEDSSPAPEQPANGDIWNAPTGDLPL